MITTRQSLMNQIRFWLKIWETKCSNLSFFNLTQLQFEPKSVIKWLKFVYYNVFKSIYLASNYQKCNLYVPGNMIHVCKSIYEEMNLCLRVFNFVHVLQDVECH